VTVLARHPTWSECPRCGRVFTADSGAAAHMTSGTSRTCRDPDKVREGGKRLVYDDVYGAWRWQTGDRPPARRTAPPRPQGRARRAGAAVPGVQGGGRDGGP
jgi:hypothetical protein